MIRATMIAPGTMMTDAVRICPKGFATMFASTFAYKIITEPATVDMPQVITVNNSLRDIFAR